MTPLRPTMPDLRLVQGGKRVPSLVDGKSEESFIGGLLRDSSEVGEALKLISPSHLRDPRLRLILQIMKNMHRRAAPITLPGVAEELNRMGILEEAGGAVLLAELFDLEKEEQ